MVNHEQIARSRLRVDARKWAAAKLAPKKYGDRIAHEHGGAGGGPIPHEHSFKKTPQEVADELASIFALAGLLRVQLTPKISSAAPT